MRAKLKDIAAKAHVSTSLVSKILNNREVRVSSKKRDQILKIAQECGYQGRMAAPVVHYKRKLIGLIQPSFEFEFLTQLTTVIQKSAHENGYDLIILNADEKVEEERRCLDICEACQVSGIILNSCDNHANIDSINTLRASGMPMVFVDRYIYEYECDYVATDNFKGSYLLTKALIEKGHKDILFVFHGKAMFTTVLDERFAGYQAAMSEHSLVSIKEYVFSGRSIKYQPVFQMNSGAPLFTAIVLSTSWDFTSLLGLLNQMRYDSDKKLDIAAFDSFSVPYEAVVNSHLFERINPDVIIAKQDVKGLGEKAVDLLIKRMKKRAQDPDVYEKILLDPTIINME